MSYKCTVSYSENENGDVYWTCRKFLMCATSKIPLHRTKCYAYTCTGRNEYVPPKPQVIISIDDPTSNIVENEIRYCKASNCSNTLERDSQISFCSRKCGNRDRKQRSRLRQKQKDHR